MIPEIFGSGKHVDVVKTKKIYDGFTNKDMTFEDFHKEIQALVDPVKMSNDVGAIMAQRRGL
jgi:hypothetical protein